MNILVLSDIEAGGEWIATQTLIEKLIKKDESIKFYLIASSKNKYLLKESLFEKIIYIRHKYYRKPFKYYRELFYQLSSGKKAISHIYKQYKFDYVIATNYILAISYLISQKKLNYIYYFHGIRNNYKIFSDTFNHFMIFQKLLEILGWIMSKELIIPSINARNVLIEHSFSLLKKRVFIVLPNLIRDEFKKSLKKTKDKKIILYSGRLALNKGVESLINAFLLITKGYPEVVLVIVYPGKPEIELLKKIKNLIGKRPKIIFINNLSTQKLSILYQTSTLAILPSPFEISSLFLREALMCDLPIITTNTGDSSQILSDVFILKNGNPDTIYAKIVDYFKNKNKYDQSVKIVSENWKKQYNEEKIINSWISVLKTYET